MSSHNGNDRFSLSIEIINTRNRKRIFSFDHNRRGNICKARKVYHDFILRKKEGELRKCSMKIEVVDTGDGQTIFKNEHDINGNFSKMGPFLDEFLVEKLGYSNP